MDANKLIRQAEADADAHAKKTGCDKLTRSEYEICALQIKLLEACAELAEAKNPPGCHEITSDFVTYGVKWDASDEVWCVYLGGQGISHVIDGGLYRELCDEAQRIELDGHAA